MAKITTTNVEAGDATSVAATNAGFTAVQTATATGALNEENVRSEGIDRRQLALHSGTGSTGRMEPLVYMQMEDNLNSGAIVDTVYTGQNGTQEFAVNGPPDLLLNFTGLPGGYLAISTGDLIRIHYTIYLKSHTDTTYTSAGSDNAADPNRQNNPADGIGLLFFPTWQLTGGGAMQVLPNEEDLLTNFGPGAGVTIDNTTSRTDAVSFVSLEGTGTGGGASRFGGNTTRMVHGTWSHVATTNYTVYGIRLYGRGPMVYQGDGSGNRQLYVPTWAAGRYATAYLDIPQSGSTFNFTLSNGQLGIVVMRGDS
jgi:hypothetical protein